MKTKYNKRQLNTAAKNTKILQATMVTLGALKEESPALEEMGINEIQVHILDEGGDGVILCLEYDEHGELSKTFSNVDEYYEEIEVELEDSDEEHEEVESFIEEAISEEYDEVLSEVFHSSEGKPPLLN